MVTGIAGRTYEKQNSMRGKNKRNKVGLNNAQGKEKKRGRGRERKKRDKVTKTRKEKRNRKK